MGESQFVSYRDFLKATYEQIHQKNPRYSLRAFAKHLEIDPAGLNRVLNDEISLSLKGALRIAVKLKLDATASKQFVDSVSQELIANAVEENTLKPACEIFVVKPTAGKNPR